MFILRTWTQTNVKSGRVYFQNNSLPRPGKILRTFATVVFSYCRGVSFPVVAFLVVFFCTVYRWCVFPGRNSGAFNSVFLCYELRRVQILGPPCVGGGSWRVGVMVRCVKVHNRLRLIPATAAVDRWLCSARTTLTHTNFHF